MAKRILVTAPAKLGAFLTLLVVACAGGLTFAFSQLFGVDLALDQASTQQGLAWIGAGALVMAGLSFLIASNLWKSEESTESEDSELRELVDSLGRIENPLDVDLSRFEGEPSIAHVVLGWRTARTELDSALHQLSRHKKDIAGIVTRIHESAPDTAFVQVRESEGAYAELASAANVLLDQARAARNTSGVNARDVWLEAVGNFRRHHSELEAFSNTVTRHCSELQRAAGAGPEHSGGGAASHPIVSEMLGRSRERLGGLRDRAEGLAEDTNALAINFALQVSRLGEPGGEMMALTEGFRGLSTKFQRLVADIQLSEYDQQVLDQHFDQMAGYSGADEGSGHTDRLVSMADTLSRRMGDLRAEIDRLGEHIEHVDSQVSIPAEDLALAHVEEAPPAVAEDVAFQAQREDDFQQSTDGPWAEYPPVQNEEVIEAPAASPVEPQPFEAPAPESLAAPPTDHDFDIPAEGVSAETVEPAYSPDPVADSPDPVYDLDQFDAQPLSQEEPQAFQDQSVAPVAETNDAFSSHSADVDAAADFVHDLSEMGAVELEHQAKDEIIYDLNDFGAVPLEG